MRGPAPKLNNLKHLYRTHEKRVPIDNRWADNCYAAAYLLTRRGQHCDELAPLLFRTYGYVDAATPKRSH